MISARSQIAIGQPVSKVYGFVVTDFFKNYPRWSPEVVELEAIGKKILLWVLEAVRLESIKAEEAKLAFK